MGNGKIRPPAESIPLNRSRKKLSRVIRSVTPIGFVEFSANPSTESFRRNGRRVGPNKNYYFLFISIYTFLVDTSRGQSRWRIFTLNDSRKGVPFENFIDIVPHFGGEIPPHKTIFFGVNRRFRAKQAKYWKFHIIKTTASIPTKFCKTLKTTMGGPNRFPTNPRWRAAAILKTVNCYISAIVRPILLKFGTMMHTGFPNMT